MSRAPHCGRSAPFLVSVLRVLLLRTPLTGSVWSELSRDAQPYSETLKQTPRAVTIVTHSRHCDCHNASREQEAGGQSTRT